MSKKEDLLGVGLLGLLMLPAAGKIILVLGIILLAIMLGLFASVYLTLQAYHMLTAVMFLGCTLIMLYLGVRTKVITKKTVEKYPWMWIIIPASFISGYLVETAHNLQLTVAPLSIAVEQQGTINFVMILLLAVGVLFTFGDLVGGEK